LETARRSHAAFPIVGYYNLLLSTTSGWADIKLKDGWVLGLRWLGVKPEDGWTVLIKPSGKRVIVYMLNSSTF
jgi:hypothetical protein